MENSRSEPPAPGSPSNELGQGRATWGERESALRQREAAVEAREAAVLESERHLGDLREANQHLVLAAIVAERLEEEAKLRKRQQDEFLAMLAHELRNPLAPIRTAVALMERLDAGDPRLKKIGDVVGRQVNLMARLLDDLLDASRVTSGKVSLHRRPIQVREFVDQAVEINRALLDAQQQQLTLDLPATPICVDGDPARLAQIFANLLHNASKYTPKGGAIALSARTEGAVVVFQVTDSGAGISTEALDSIFDLFAQEERGLSRSQGGLGIGLTVVRSMVQLHGGTVVARSEGIGRGSEFTVVLPRVDHVVNATTVPEDDVVLIPARILIVDDNVDAAEMLAMVLVKSGYEVEIAYDGPRALTLFERQRSQFVLCDIGLPGMDGYQVAKRIREEGSGRPRPVLIALTGYDSAADRSAAIAAGFDHHVAKPVDFNDLLKLINQRRGAGPKDTATF